MWSCSYAVVLRVLLSDVSEEPLRELFGSVGPIDHVRIVRDSKTNVGKGFAYIMFKVSTCHMHAVVGVLDTEHSVFHVGLLTSDSAPTHMLMRARVEPA